MSGYLYKESAEERVNFLDSAVGLVLKTAQIDNTGIEADESGYKIVKAGTIYPADNGTAKGIVFEDTDITHGAKAGSILIAGRVIKDRLNISNAAVTALSKSGVVFCDSTAADRTGEPENSDTAEPENGGSDESKE